MTELAPPETDRRRIELDVHGMTCIACSHRVAKMLNKVDGVHAAVKLSTGVALVEHDGSLEVSELCDVIARAGYRAELRAVSLAAETVPGGARKGLPEQVLTLIRRIFRWPNN